MRRRRGPVRTLTAAGAVAIAIAGAPLAGAAVYHGVVLGAKDFISAPAHGIGWGTPRPKTIFNGGDPSGYVSGIRWTTWGGRVAVGFGLTSLYKPGGGYYARPGRIELKALDIGHCDAGGPRAYTKLVARVAVRPGGRLGAWFLWGGQKSLCRWQ